MAHFRLLVVCALALGVCISPARASNCATEEYDHNGSLMEMQICDGGGMSISYARPRSGLVAVGALSGTLLFDGTERAGGAISGQARRFSKTCGPIAYAVTGRNHGGSIILQGNAPSVDRHCQITGYRPDKLLFTLQGAAAPPAGGPAVVAPTCPPGYLLSQGTCISGTPAPAGRDWYAIGGTFGSRGEARGRANQFGPGWLP